MDSFEEFRDDLQDTLVHLHDPDYRPSPRVCQVLGCQPEEGTAFLRVALSQFIEHLRTDPSMLADSRSHRCLELLRQRYLIKLTQEAIAEHIGIGVRSIQRLQREAAQMLAMHLWENSRIHATGESAKTAGWLSQVRQELVVLTQSNPHAEADLASAIQGALRIAQATATNQGITFETMLTAVGQVRLHPSALRQVLLDVITELQRNMASGKIRLNTRQTNDYATLTITAGPMLAPSSIDIPLARELLTAQGASITTANEGERFSLVIQVPLATQATQSVTVLVVDDNPDLVTLYESYCAETMYKIVHVGEGKRVRQAIAEAAPSIILLDVMLPDVDGWDLLLDLHANPETRAIPIIVCSVVTDAKLAHDLGAVQYLRKPVWRKQLLTALDEALNPSASTASRARANNPGTW